uniref:Uncharacterized protein n=1 Tax=Anguilla anguilla TaxID=7936 RepID=A0A0E9XF85_ANGAN
MFTIFFFVSKCLTSELMLPQKGFGNILRLNYISAHVIYNSAMERSRVIFMLWYGTNDRPVLFLSSQLLEKAFTAQNQACASKPVQPCQMITMYTLFWHALLFSLQ